MTKRPTNELIDELLYMVDKSELSGFEAGVLRESAARLRSLEAEMDKMIDERVRLESDPC